MLLVREVLHCKPGKVRPMAEKFLAMSDINEKAGHGRFRVMTDFSGDRYWTVVAEIEMPNMQALEDMMSGKGMNEDLMKQFEKVMEGYHDLIHDGHREIFKIEEPKA